ncbi:MAG: hypothetical protein IIA75_05215, partial [Proteobacteria bacterium]|nr:hypothetical protein [Pseudomonadota bacterium]
VTVALRRIDTERHQENILEYIPQDITLLVNTSGARNAQEALRIARLARETGCGDWIKIEVIDDSKYLLPNNKETIKATELLVKEGFKVLPYMQPDLYAARELVKAGASTIMPLGSLIGSNQGLKAKEFIRILIDEIDKADIEFPNDLLLELDRMEFFVYETGEIVKAKVRPVVVITSNNEKELPDAFLRRCFFHYIQFPDRKTMQAIVDVHHPNIKKDLVKEAMEIFFDVRKVPGLKKKPSTSELIDWLKLLMADDIPDEILTNRDTTKAIPPLYGALVKNEQDVQLLERLAFMNRRQSSSSGGGSA